MVRFAVLGGLRRGTTFLQSLIKSHRRVKMFGEILNLGIVDDLARKRIITDSTQYLEREVFKWRYWLFRAVGFKVLYDQLNYACLIRFYRNIYEHYPLHPGYRQRIEFVIRQIEECGTERYAPNLERLGNYLKGFRILHLKRNNKLEVLLSCLRAMRSDQWIVVKNASRGFLPLMKLEYEDCVNFFTMAEECEMRFDSFFKGPDVLEIVYEDLLSHRDREMKRVLSFLDLPDQNLFTPYIKNKKCPIAQELSNYHSLKREFGQSKWSVYFQE
ncbi:MAG: sulfotransferase [Candidatus Omnitrophica bacterium]|nr:sulfotransferase [Candidatus Omnitrophota bacterium]MDD5671563.1 sulfotransferase [Candidatus Omnitrophota bacterium]